MRAWSAYRARLVAEHGERWADPSTPAFVGIDRWGHITGGMCPDFVTRAINRISKRAGVPIHWTGRSLRTGLTAVGRPGEPHAVTALEVSVLPDCDENAGPSRFDDHSYKELLLQVFRELLRLPLAFRGRDSFGMLAI